MKHVLVAVVALVSCTTSSRFNATKLRDPAKTGLATAESTAYPYPSIYRNVGTVGVDTTIKSH